MKIIKLPENNRDLAYAGISVTSEWTKISFFTSTGLRSVEDVLYYNRLLTEDPCWDDMMEGFEDEEIANLISSNVKEMLAK